MRPCVIICEEDVTLSYFTSQYTPNSDKLG